MTEKGRLFHTFVTLMLNEYILRLYSRIYDWRFFCELRRVAFLCGFITARCTLVQSAVLRSHVVCLSVCNVGEL